MAQEGREAYRKGLDGRRFTPRYAGAPRNATEDVRYCKRAIPEGLYLELGTKRSITQNLTPSVSEETTFEGPYGARFAWDLISLPTG